MPNHFKDIKVDDTDNLGDALMLVSEQVPGLDRIRSVLALKMNQYNSLKLEKDDIRKIAISFQDIEVGSSTNLVMICSKADCLYKSRCALYANEKLIEGLECLHENKILANAMSMYLDSLEVSPDNYPEMVLVNQLVEYELIEYRCNAILSNYHKNLKMESVIGVDEAGRVITKEEISHALTIKMQVFKNKMSILQEFTATRRERYKKQAALKEGKEGPSKMISSIKAKMKELQRKDVEMDDIKSHMSALEDESFSTEE